MENEKLIDIETAISYAQLAVYTLHNSNVEITPKQLRYEMKMLFEKFGTKEIKRLKNIFMRGKI